MHMPIKTPGGDQLGPVRIGAYRVYVDDKYAGRVSTPRFPMGIHFK